MPLLVAGCTAAHGAVPCDEGRLVECRCEVGYGSTVCRRGAFGPCQCAGACDLEGAPQECTCPGGWGLSVQWCIDGGWSRCDNCSERLCETGRSFGCWCGSGSEGTMQCGADGILDPCVCAADDAGPRDLADARDAPWPDGCAPILCEEVRCGYHRSACGINVICGDCAAETWFLEIDARDLAWDATRGLIYLSTPSTDAGQGNAIVAVDPVARSVAFEVSLASSPGQIEISDDASALYVALEGTGTVQRVDLGPRLVGLEFEVGRDLGGSLHDVADMAVLPGHPGSLVVTASAHGVARAVAVHDEGVMRPVTVDAMVGSVPDQIEAASPTIVHCYDSASAGFEVSTLSIDGRGATVVSSTAGLVSGDLVSGHDVQVTYEGGLLFSTVGDVVDPAAGRRLGVYGGAVGLVASEEATDRTYFVTDGLILAFERAMHREVARLRAPRGVVRPAVRRLVRWGPRGLAYLHTESRDGELPARLVVITTDLVAEPR